MDTRLQITSAAHDGYAVVIASGEVDLASAHRLGHEITQAVKPGATLILDLSAITFMDSAGLHAVLSGNRDATALDASLVLVASPVVTWLFELSGADHVLTVSPSLAEAVATRSPRRTGSRSFQTTQATRPAGQEESGELVG